MERFVIIDDDAINNIKCRFVINKVVNDAEIYTFLSAKEGLQFLKEDVPKGVTTFAFLDINMPEIDGWEALNIYEKLDDKIKSKIKLYMLSSSIDPTDINRAKANKNVIDYIEKPLTFEKFEEVIKK